MLGDRQAGSRPWLRRTSGLRRSARMILRVPVTCSSVTRAAPSRSWEATARELHHRTKAEAIILGNLALAYTAQSQVDEAVAALHKAIDVIEVT